MKIFKGILGILIFALMMCSVINITVFADIGFEADKISVSDLPENFTESLRISEQEMTKTNIRMFDVSPSGEILLCLKNNYINVYSSSAEFMYSIRFEIGGSSIAFWDNDNIAVYLNRGDIVAAVDKNGSIVDAYKVQNTVENGKLYRKIEKSQLENDDYIFEISSVLFNYAELKRIDKTTGDEVSVYKNETSLIVQIIFILFFAGIFIIVILNVRKQIRSCKKQ